MVKFSKQLELQLVPEWKTAFCNYWKLKKDLRPIRLQTEQHGAEEPSLPLMNSAAGLLLAGQGLLRRRGSPSFSSSPPSSHQDIVKVHHKRCLSQGQVEIYETELLEPLCKDDNEVAFFKAVDEELNKVNGFYATKEDESGNKMEVLKRQLMNLIEMRKALEEHQTSSNSTMNLRLIAHKPPSNTHKKGQELSRHQATNQDHNHDASCVLTSRIRSGQLNQGMGKSYDEEKGIGSCKHLGGNDNNDHDLQIEANQKVIQASPTPVLTTISSFTHLLWDVDAAYDTLTGKRNINHSSQALAGVHNLHDMIVTRRKLQCARKMLRTAFAEFYRGLGLLKTFSSLNMLAFGKILKKYDKVTGRNASTPYLKALERSRLNNSNKVDHLIDEVERLFAQFFAKGDHKRAMMLLKPGQQKSCHTTTYFVGLFSGWSISFLVAFIILLHLKASQFNDSKLQNYAQLVYPLYSTFFLVVFHMFMYGWNVYAWRQTRINYPFIFEFAPSTELRSKDIFFVCTCLTMLGVASMVCHLTFYLGGATFLDPDSIPFATILVCVLVLFCPFNVFHRSSRYFFLSSIKRIIFAPFYKVIMVDFFLADQLTSQVGAIRQGQYIVCHYLGGHMLFNACKGHMYHHLTYVFSFLPYWWRLMQCLRRWSDDGDHMHLVNGGKYLSAIVAVGFRLTFQFYPTAPWLVVFIISSSLATIYQMYWDIIMDWGLLQPHSKNPWLRDQLVLKNKSLYFISMGINCLLRFAWIQSLLHLQVGKSDDYLISFIFALLEVFRRGHWNFYRLENEHLNNVGKYRAVKTLPLPFRDDFVASI